MLGCYRHGARLLSCNIHTMGPAKAVEFADGSKGEFDVVLLNTGRAATVEPRRSRSRHGAPAPRRRAAVASGHRAAGVVAGTAPPPSRPLPTSLRR
jgi:hypothetical protein